MRSTTFEVIGRVFGKARPRFTRDGHAFTPTSTRVYERAVRQAYEAAGGELLDGAVHIDIEAVAELQKSATKKQKAARLQGDELAMTKPDIDNVCKLVLDALNGVAYADDRCVVSVRLIKGRYETEPRLIVRVRELNQRDIMDAHSNLFSDGDSY